MSAGELFWAGMAALGVLAAVVLPLPTLAVLCTLKAQRSVFRGSTTPSYQRPMAPQPPRPGR